MRSRHAAHMRVLLVHCDARPFEMPRFGEAWAAAGGDPSELVAVTPLTAPGVLAGGRAWHGLLLTGGPDVEPHRYGQVPLPGVSLQLDPTRDALDLALLGRAETARWPVLAVCYGCQVLAVAAGGALIQDLPSMGLEGHRHTGAPDAIVHTVRVHDGAAWLPTGAVLGVNSRHHQAVADPGSLQVVATAPDGVIEAVEGREADRFLLGVQWHAEQLAGAPGTGVLRDFRAACLVTCGENGRDATLAE
ncbi:MAG: gamma-glutamyl-gamma-aminobutyrate hydrolase family protein [Thermoanaerobaculaceae bacterium]|nr:gamma-glutamyl-gamma-aminobutyrate hydrolase family protein [Thermoanaerobaculaceae bacterium]MDI9621479.1 gamma-glutamyl-gamma-aminobutyrate hydrolase family protein [Acidobacteriota bacterium]